MNILVALSGGVDSALTAYFLKQQGHNVIGCYMKLYDDEKKHQQNIEMIDKIASFINIKYHILDLTKEFSEIVVNSFFKAYQDGITPNPCVCCNKNIKFGALVEFAKKLGVDKLATGHYAQIKDGLLYEADDSSKDQSYFLSQINPEILDFIMFPLGDKYKYSIKNKAFSIKELESFSTQKESNEICFVEKNYIDILSKYISTNQEGNVLNTKGETVGKHQGYMHYTIGKRKGFTMYKAHDPHYVISINPKLNEIVVGSKDDLKSKVFHITSLNFFKTDLQKIFNAEVKIRYRSPKLTCTVEVDEDKFGATVHLNDYASAITKGQIAAFYSSKYLIASGIIS